MSITTLLQKILLVEDSPSELELMSHYLQDSGYEIIKATGAKEALEIAINEQPNAIVTDIVMPGMSGFELCRSLKRNPATVNISIIISSSKNQVIDKVWGIKQGADAYLTKPYSREQLLNVIKSLAK
ncbi:MAG: response regulator [Calothrix sp. MO_167.B12]|nr:response regulator [Calothrix sp. MO_167.B12]